MKRSPTVSRVAAAGFLSAIALCTGGCLERTIAITTQPPGALVWLNDVEVGRTPLETDFTFYGVYDVRIRREGYEPIITKAKAKAPVQEWVGIDLLAEAAPIRFHDHVRWHWDLTPVAEAATDDAAKQQAETDLLTRARDMRTEVPALLSPGTKLKSEPEKKQSTAD